MQHLNIFLFVDHIRMNTLKMEHQHLVINTISDKENLKVSRNILHDHLFTSYRGNLRKHPRFYLYHQDLCCFPKIHCVIWSSLSPCPWNKVSKLGFISRRSHIIIDPLPSSSQNYAGWNYFILKQWAFILRNIT